MDMLSGFSRKYGYPRYRRLPEEEAYCRLSALEVALPASISTYGLQRPIPSGRGGVTAPSPRRSSRGSRNINRVCHRPRRSAEP